MIGQMLGGYRIVEQIGQGGMALVYKAYDAGTDRYVALKVLPAYYSGDSTFRERFQREAKAIARLEHPHILTIHAYGEDQGTAYLVMRYMAAGTLADRIAQGQMSLAEASRYLSQIAGALDTAHEQGILHRDVKPSNVLVDNKGSAFLTDFGIARMVEGTQRDLTGSGLIGTPQYMSPEQCLGGQEITAASDQYSLGVMAYEMVTGHKPFNAETPIAVINMQVSSTLPPPRTLRADLPEAVERAILKAMAKAPEDRFPNCGAFAEAFDDAVRRAASTAHMEASHQPQTVPVAGSTTPPGQPASFAAPSVAPAAPRSGVPCVLIAVIVGVVALVALLIFGAAGLGLIAMFGPGGGIIAAAPTTTPSPVPPTSTPLVIRPTPEQSESTATPIATVDTNVLLSDNFESASPIHAVFGTDYMHMATSDGILSLTSVEPGVMVGIYDDPAAGDFSLIVEMQGIHVTAESGYGVVFHSNDVVGGEIATFGVVELFPNEGTGLVTMFENNDWSDVISFDLPSSAGKDGHWVTLNVEATGARMRVSVDSEEVVNIQNRVIARDGIFGLFIGAADDTEQVVHFDNLRIDKQN